MNQAVAGGRVLRCVVLSLLTLGLALTAHGEELVKVNAEKYPQDTPEKAVVSIIKALDDRDFDYWISWLITPADKERLTKEHGSLRAAAIFNADDKHAPRIRAQARILQRIRELNKTTQGEDGGVKWFRFHENGRILQFERQGDGRWCMNASVAKRPDNADK